MLRLLLSVFALLVVVESRAEARYTPTLLSAPLVSPATRILADRIIIIDSAPRVPMEPPPAKWASCWNLFIPGLGQLVLGKPLRGLLFFLGTVVPIWAFVGLFVRNPDMRANTSLSNAVGVGATLVSVGVWGWSFFDAWALGERIDGR